MQEYDFVIKHRAGLKYANANACLRNLLPTTVDRWAKQDHDLVSVGECVTVCASGALMREVERDRPSG